VSSVTESVDVRAPVSRVYNQLTQFESFPRFMGAVEKISQVVKKDLQRFKEFIEQRGEETGAWRGDVRAEA
jgi:uncharacterized membrane protein